MSTSLDHTKNVEEQPSHPKHTWIEDLFSARKSYTWLFWGSLAFLVLIAILMRLYHLDAPFDRDSYDEGVYWQSLRQMASGQGLYSSVFYSQPPIFLFSTFPAFILFGQSLWAARFGIVLVSLLGFIGAGIIGKTLAGRVGVLAALLLLLTDSLYLFQSQTIQAEASSTAFALLTMGFALLWWKQPDGKWGMCWAALTGLTLVLSIFSKLLGVAALVPIGLLMLMRIWQIWRKWPGTSNQSWWPIVCGVGVALLTTFIAFLPFASVLPTVWSTMWTFHEVAAKIDPTTTRQNARAVKPFLLSVIGGAALYGTAVALLRKDWRVFPLLAWLLTTVALLIRQHPLFAHHMVALEPPLIALAVMGVATSDTSMIHLKASPGRKLFPAWNTRSLMTVLAVLGVILVLLTSAVHARQDIGYYQGSLAGSVNASARQEQRVAADLDQAISPSQWVVTDGQFIAGLANRNTPPSLVDTSGVRISTGYVTLAQLIQTASNPRTHAVLFYTNRFHLPPVSGFRSWVKQHFHLLHTYGPGQELWVR